MTQTQTHGLATWTGDDAEEWRSALTLADSAAAYLRAASGVDSIDSLIVLGTGWRGALDTLLAGDDGETAEILWRASAPSVPGFVEPAAEQNVAEVLMLRIGWEDDDVRHVLVHTGRPHLYDGYGVHAPVHSVRVAAALGADRVLLTSDCGGLRDDLAPGTTLLIRDHLNPTFATPLVGAQYIDLRGMWSQNLAEAAREYQPDLRDACYAFVPGPQYQTPTEVRHLRASGADCVGMSTVLEALAARERTMEIVGLSIVSSAESNDEPTDPAAVLREARRVTSSHGGLLRHLLLAD